MTLTLAYASPPNNTSALAALPSLEQLHLVDEAVGTGAAFVFDRLTAVQAAWGEGAALTFS